MSDQKKKEFVQEYSINHDTPAGRIDWAINDYMRTHNLDGNEREELVFATIQEISEWSEL